MKKILVLVVFVSSGLISLAQKKETKDAGANYSYDCRCIGSELDGSITLEAWGKGRNYLDASEQAKKNAVRDVIFNGIKDGNESCQKGAILIGARPEEKYEDYFATFFADEGEYLKYVSLKDERIVNKVKRDAKKAEEFQQRMVVVRVNRQALKKKLAEDKIN